MRRVLQSVAGTPDHVGLTYDAWAPAGDDGKVPDDERTRWLSNLTDITVAPDYPRAFERWRASFHVSGDRVFELVLASRLLVGHGNSSAVDVGMTVHHSWGVPVIPGSALKGLVAHYVDAVYGPDDPALPPWEQPADDRMRADYQGVTWRGRRIERGPGPVYRALFGSPDTEGDDEMRARALDAGASAGTVLFHDALYVPQSCANDRPFALDVLTVHHKAYYDAGLKWAQWRESGRGPEPKVPWPNDYDSPNPVAFLTVRPGVRMLFALSGPADWTELAERLLRDGLDRWGVGGKTSAGYGRLVAPERHTATARRLMPTVAGHPVAGKPRVKAGERVEAILLEERTKKGGWKALHEASGLSGAIQNSGDVPATEKAGNRITLMVASVSAREIAFRFPTDAPASGNKGKR